mgnify:CR=1 FL=1
MRGQKRLTALCMSAILTLALSVAVFAAVEDTGFSDVDTSAWYAEAVIYCREHSLMTGVGNKQFAPESCLTRAMLVTILWWQAGSPTVNYLMQFSDVPEGQWYSEAVRWSASEGLIVGYGDGRFGTNDLITQAHLNIVLNKYTDRPVTENIPGFTGGDIPVTRAQTAEVMWNLAQNDPGEGSSVLVAYFSRYGNTDYDSDVDATTSASVVVENGQRQGSTEHIARMVADQTGGDLHLIETAEEYPADFNDVVEQNHREISNGTRPALSSHVDLADYDVIFIGYPVWASNAPTPVLSFLEDQNLSGKTVIPFCTHDGYGAGSSYSAIRSSSTGAAVEQGLAVDSSRVSSVQSTVASWLNGLDLPAAGGTDSQPAQGERAIRITIGDTRLEGVLYDSDMARQFITQLPQTITMSNYGGREIYGGIDQAITVEGEEQLRFEDGDITYCPANNTAAIFYGQSSNPNLTMRIYPIGKVTSDLSIFPGLPSRVNITFEIIP